jgi:2-oxoglutarate-Fe(II)-dependent dioxygenase family protein
MRIIRLRHDHKTASAALRGEFPAPQHADQIMGGEDTIGISPYGDIEALLLTNRIAPHYLQQAFETWWPAVQDSLSNRGSVAGSRMLPGRKLDGSFTTRNRVPDEVLRIQPGRQAVLGYLVARQGLPPYLTKLTVQHPELIYKNQELLELCARLHAHELPNIYNRQLAEVADLPWRLRGLPYTTCYLIKGHRCAYHADHANLRDVLSAMFPLGYFTGGSLILCRWRLRIDYAPGDILYFNPQNLHGNLPVAGQRLSVVLYCHKWIAKSIRVAKITR